MDNIEKKSVLIVDDSVTIRSLLKAYLEENGYNVETSSDGEEGLEALKKAVPDVILLDFVMPKINGYQFCKSLFEMKLEKMPLIILMSAKGDKIGELFVNKLAVSDTITKPFNPQVISSLIEYHFKQNINKNKQDRTIPPAYSETELDLEDIDLFLGDVEENRSTDEEFPTSPRQPIVAGIKIKPNKEEAFNLIKNRVADIIIKLLDKNETQDQFEIKERIINKLNSKELIELEKLLFKVAENDCKIGLQGEIALVSMEEIIQLLQLQSQTGELEVITDNISISIYFRDGLIDLIIAHGSDEKNMLAKFLIISKIITEMEFINFVEKIKDESSITFGEKLVKHGIITTDQLMYALKEQSCELFYDIFRWNSGMYTFWVGSTHPLAQSAKLSLSVDTLLLEALRRIDEWRLIEKEIPSLDIKISRIETGTMPSKVVNFSEEEKIIYELISKNNTIKEIIKETPLSYFETCKIIYRLISMKYVIKLN